MNKYYVIVPGALLLLFLGFERDFQQKREAEEKARTATAEATKAETEKNRLIQQRRSAEEVRARTEERERLERERSEKKRRDYDILMATVKDQADTQAAEAEKLARDLATLGSQLVELRQKRDLSETEAFELARKVALQRVDRRNAEIEIQRTTTMVATRLSESTWANPPPGSPPAPGK